MHRKMLDKITEAQAKEFIDDVLVMLASTDKKLYESLEDELYCRVYGPHFNEWTLNKAVKELVNDDGTIGAHWTLDQTNQVANQLNVRFDHFNNFDFNYSMNMLFSDFVDVLQDDAVKIGKLAVKFLTDKDGPKGKAYKYWTAMKKGRD